MEILHLKARKFETKVASRQNSVNYHPRTQIMNCVKIMILYVELRVKLHIALWGSCNGKLEIGIFHFLERNISGIFGHG